MSNALFQFSSNSFCRNFLNKWRQGDEEESWTGKAIETLLKKFRKVPNELVLLQQALKDRSPDSACVTLPRSQDGRLQVSHRKMLPHVMYCRVFRWPDLQSQHELKSTNNCQYPPHRRENTRICINPYHYTRVEHTIYPSVVTPRDNSFPAAASSPRTASPVSAAQSLSPSHYVQNYPSPAASSSEAYYSPFQFNSTLSQSPPPGYSDYPMEGTEQSSVIRRNPSREDAWCQISYYELSSKLGPLFMGADPKISVDGYTNCSYSNRFSLGAISNVNRNIAIESTRRAIGKGICLEDKGTQVYIKNLSSGSVFFHSKNCNVENQLQQHTVVKINPNQSHKIFDKNIFDNLLQDALNSQENVRFERVYSLTEHCIIKISFLKGWGSIYMRQDVTSTPCWIEVHLMKPHAAIDLELNHIGAPKTNITSTS